jgi:hypothetical protein
MRHASTRCLCLIALLFVAGGLSAQTVFPTGTTIWQRLETNDGPTLYLAPDREVKLIDMGGDVIHTWSPPEGERFVIAEPLLDPEGHLLVYVDTEPGIRRGTHVRELDWNGNTVWEWEVPETLGVGEEPGTVRLHHDVERLPNGNTLLLCSFFIEVPTISPRRLLDDCILEVTPGGQIAWRWITHQHFEEFGFSQKARGLIRDAGGDWAHANSLSVLPENPHSGPALAKGNLLVSYRFINTVAVVGRPSGHVLAQAGPNGNVTIGQHHVYMIPEGMPGAGNVLAFDNGGPSGYPLQGRPYSRVVEMNPANRTMVWDYVASMSGVDVFTFYTSDRGGAQRLPNGNTMIVEAMEGRIFEVDPEGEIVWEYMTPFTWSYVRHGKPVFTRAVYRAYRLPIGWGPGSSAGAGLRTAGRLAPLVPGIAD